MAEFDMDAYLRRRPFNPNGVDRLQGLEEATQTKIKALQQYSAERQAQASQRQQSLDDSVVGMAGLDPDGVAGIATNLAVRGGAALSKAAGMVGSSVWDLLGAAANQHMPDEVKAARKRQLDGNASPADLELLALPAGDTTKKKYPATADYETNAERIQRMERYFGNSKDVRNLFDLSNRVYQGNTQELQKDILDNSQKDVAKVSDGIQQFKKGEYLDSLANIGSGVAGSIKAAVKAGANNPLAVVESLVDQAPNLATAAAGAIPGSIYNALYGMDTFGEGVQAKIKKAGGAMPSDAELASSAKNAALAAAAEVVGDKAMDITGILKGGKLAAKASQDAVEEIARKTVKEKLLGLPGDLIDSAAARVAKVAAKSGIGEYGTEGAQTYLEKAAKGEDASLSEINLGASMGLLTGAPMSGSMHAAAELAGATPEKAQKRAEKAKTEGDHLQAIQANDTAAYLDPKSGSYNPVKAAQVLFGHAQLDTTSEETKQANLTQASKIVTDLEAQKAKAQAAYDAVSPDTLKQLKQDLVDAQSAGASSDHIQALQAEIADVEGNAKRASQLEAQLSKLDRQIEGVRMVKDGLGQMAQPKEADIATHIELADGAVSSQDADTQVKAKESANTIINLSMAHPNALSSEAASRLANNTQNGLSEQQRAYLRSFSEARAAENKLKTMGVVGKELLEGDPAKRQLGITQYRSRVADAIQAGNQAEADRNLAMLAKFTKNHADKSRVAIQALRDSISTGKAIQIVPTKTGWAIASTPMTNDDLRKAEGLTIHKGSGKLVGNIQGGFKALYQADAELRAAYALRFAPGNEQAQSSGNTQKNVVNSSTPESTQSTAVNTVNSEQSNVDGTVNITEPSTTAGKPSVQDQKNEAASSSIQEETITPSNEGTEFTGDTGTGDQQSTESTQDTAEQVEDGKLANFSKEHDASQPYNKQDLISGYFTQSVGSETGTQRPLVKVKDFLSQLAKGVISVKDFLLKPESFDGERQIAAFAKFREQAAHWAPMIQANLVAGNKRQDNPDFYFNDLMQFLIQKDGKQLDLEENVKTAMSVAAFSWVAENATRSAANSDEEINLILGRDEDHLVSDQERDALAFAGTRENVVINGLGQRAVQALGLKPTQDAPKDLLPRLESALGAHILKLLMDDGVLARSIVPGTKMAALTGNTKTDKNANFKFISLARDTQRNLNAKAEAIYQANKGSQGFMDKLFSVESAAKEPGFEPIPFNQKTTRNTQQRVPERLAKIVSEKNAEANYVRQDMWHLMSQLDEAVALAMAGVAPISEKDTHKSKRTSIEAKNDGLIREFKNFMDYVDNTVFPSEKGLEQPLYLEHSVWKQQRVGVATNVINPQSSKIHRFMLFRKAWETQVSMNDLDSFKLRVLEGLGVKTDKQGNEESLKQFDIKTGAPEIKAAVALLQKQLYDGTESMSAQDQQTLLKGVKEGGEKFHSLDALVALAHFEQAKATGKDSFTVQMVGEVDGVTNGPMLSHLLLGAASSAKELFGLLNRGGFFQEGSGNTNYNVWRGQPGHTDLYETTTRHVLDNVRQLLNAKGKDAVDQRLLKAVYAFTGQLENEKTGAIEKAGRNIIKTPLTAMVFGSSVPSALDSMANKFVESIYDSMEATATQKKNALSEKELILSLRALGVSLNPGESLLEREFNEAEIRRLKYAFRQTLGKAVEATMKQDFAVFMDNRKILNRVAQVSFALYDAAYQGYRKEFLAEMVQRTKDGRTDGIPINGAGKPIRDLTQAEERALRQKVAGAFPVIQTLLAKDSNDAKAGLLSAKTDRKLSDEPQYASSIQFGQAFADNKAFSVGTHGFTTGMTDPGVAMMVMLIHSTDSAISHYAAEGNEVLNVHDAHGSGLGQFEQTARNLNKATWQAMLNYSPAMEMLATFEKTIQALNASVKTAPDMVKTTMADAILKMAKDEDVDPTIFLSNLAVNAGFVARDADTIKLEALSQMSSVDQYALEGGNYAVTEEDRAAAKEKLSQVPAGTSQQLLDAVSGVEEVLHPLLDTQSSPAAKPVPLANRNDPAWQSPVLQLGKPQVASNPDVVAIFTNTPKQTAGDVMAALLQSGALNPINQKILALVSKLIDPSMKVEMLTSGSDLSEVDLANSASLGWFVKGTEKNPKGAVFLLGPDFKHAGLSAEVVLHELVHAALVDVAANVSKELAQNGGVAKSEAAKAMAELNTLMEKAAEYVKKHGLSQWEATTQNMDEFIAYGMTSQDFQRAVLTKLTMKSNTTGTKLVTGMQKFISSLTALLFKKPNEKLDNGLTVLIQNVSALAYQAAQDQKQDKAEGPVIRQMAAQIRDMTTIDLFEALPGTASAFQEKMRDLLDGIVSKLHGPFGSLKASRMAQTVLAPTDLWAQALAANEAPFASAALASGFKFTDQEAFVLEQVEATVQAALAGDTNQTTFAYSELAKLYSEVRSKVFPQDFVTAGVAATLAEAKALHDFIFKMEKSNGDRADYLSRFAAVGLAHEGFNKILDMATERTTPGNQAKGFVARLEAFFQKAMSWIVGRVTHTFEGQAANEKLEHLVDQLIGIEAKKRASLLSQESNLLEPLEIKGKEVTELVRRKLGELGQSAVFKQSKSGFVRAGGALVSVVANDRLDYLMEGFTRLRDRHFKERQGILAGLINEIRGANDTNKPFHALLRETKRHENERKHEITAASKLVLESFANQGTDLNEAQKTAISYVFLRTDMVSLLDKHGLSGIRQLLNSPSSLQREIRALESQLAAYPKFQHYFAKQAKVTAYFMVSNKTKGTHLMMNAGNIARMYDTPHAGHISEQEAQKVEAILDQLITLRAIEYTEEHHKVTAKDVLTRELNRSEGNGVEMVLKLHREMQKQSRDRLFSDSQALMAKGYTPEIYNPYREVKVANAADGAKLIKMGYVRGAAVALDPSEKNQTELYHLYLLRDGGLRSHLTGTISYTGMRAKGSRARTDGVQDMNDWRANQDDLKSMYRIKQSNMGRMFSPDPTFDPREVKETYAAPVLDANGQVMDYRYLMQAETKDKLMERDNRFEKILGTLAGSIYDKETSAEQNRKVVEALHQQYQEDFKTKSESYVRIGPDSTEAEYRDIWKLLPESTKQAVRDVWGSEGMLVRVDLLDINFGYRKSSLSDVFTKDAATRNIAERFFADFLTHILGEKAALRVRQAEDIWQEVVKETKDILVVKTGMTLMGNVVSNLSELVWFGVSFKDILKHHQVALKGAADYRKDREALDALKLKLGADYRHGNRAEMEREVIRLEDAIARNPVRELIEAGLMPSIVEDVASEDDLYSYKSRFVRHTDVFTGALNPSVVKAGRVLYMAKDTKMYQALSYGTQISDFVARYTLYQHLTNRKKDPMDKAAAVQLASDAFVNYDVPSHRTVQYMNDMGAVWFTKYYLRIQKVIMHLYRDQPGRALALLALGEYMNSLPLLTDSQFVHRLNNPFSIGALKYAGSLDDLATVKAGMAMF